MFFRKKRTSEKDEPIAKKGIKKMDAVVTGAILGTIVASIYGVKKLQKPRTDDTTPTPQTQEEAPKKQGFWKRLFSSKK